jgi:Uma2 family endonuclease
MTTVPSQITTGPVGRDIEYPTSDGRPFAETDLHRTIMAAAIETLQLHFAKQPVYVSGNLLLYYKPGCQRRRVSPDVMVVKGLEQRNRDNYLLWEEGRAPNVVIEVTSASTRDEDLDDKFEIYRDAVRVAEYFLFDPRGEYLSPVLQGYRLIGGQYVPIEPASGRLPSLELGLVLEERGGELRFFDPAAGKYLPTQREARETAEAARSAAEAGRDAAEAKAEQLVQELESLRRQLRGG